MAGHFSLASTIRDRGCEDIYLKAYSSMAEAKKGLVAYFQFYNENGDTRTLTGNLSYGLLRLANAKTDCGMNFNL